MVGSICSRNWPLATKSPSLTAILVMRPPMSGLMSTFFLGWILPLAVTAATRSRRDTFSNRTSAPRSRRAPALTTTRAPINKIAPPPTSSLLRLDMSLRFLSLTQRPADGGLEGRQGLVVIVHRAYVVRFGAQRRDLRVEQLEEGAGADPIALRGELELLARRRPVRVLDRDRAVRRLKREVRLAPLRLHREAPRPHRLRHVAVLGARLRQLRRAREVGEDRQRDREPGLERLPRELEGVLRVLVAQRLLVRAPPHQAAAVVGGEARVGPDPVVVEAIVVLLAVCRLLAADDGLDVRELLSEPRPLGRERHAGPEARRRGLHAPPRRSLAGAQRLERGVLRLRHRQQLVELPRRRDHGEGVRELHGLHVHRRRHAELLEQTQLLDAHRRLRAQQRHFRLTARHLRLAHVDQRRPADGVARLRELQERSEERRVGKECRSRWSPYH